MKKILLILCFFVGASFAQVGVSLGLDWSVCIPFFGMDNR